MEFFHFEKKNILDSILNDLKKKLTKSTSVSKKSEIGKKKLLGKKHLAVAAETLGFLEASAALNVNLSLHLESNITGN